MSKGSYTLTESAENDLLLVKAWCLSRWNKNLTKKYFKDLHEGAEYIAKNHTSLRARDELAGDTGLLLYPVLEQNIVYLPVAENHLIIVAFIRQVRDVPSILAQDSYRISREIKDIREKIERGEIKF